jgi:hypothetical protein
MNYITMRDCRRGINWWELLESMHLLAPAGEVVLTPGVAWEAKIIFPVFVPYDLH